MRTLLSTARPCADRKSCTPRWKRCTEDVDDDLGEALGQAYVAKYFSPDAKQQALKMVKEIETAMQQDIDSLPWMSGATKEQALDQAARDRQQDRLSRQVARLQQARDRPRRRTRQHQPRAHGSNSIASSRKSASPSIAGEWDMTPPTVNAYYNPQMNDINFPAGVLQPPSFDRQL